MIKNKKFGLLKILAVLLLMSVTAVFVVACERVHTHKWSVWEETEATCSVDGIKSRVCTKNSSHTEEYIIHALGHDWRSWSQATGGGSSIRVCTRNSSHKETRFLTSSGILFTFLEDEINDGSTLQVAGYAGTESELRIPSTYNGKSVVSIGHEAFRDNRIIQSVEIPESITNIGYWPFLDCPNLESINVNEANSYYISSNGVLYNKSKSRLICYPANKSGLNFDISLSVLEIDNMAFQGCSNLENIEIPASVTNIGFSAFSDSTSLKSVTFANGSTIEELHGSIFSYCTNLVNIEIPASVTKIGNYAFRGCTSLKHIKIPAGVKVIDTCSFALCSSLESIELPASVIAFGVNSFAQCSSLTDIYFLGSQSQWEVIKKTNSEFPESATIHFDM